MTQNSSEEKRAKTLSLRGTTLQMKPGGKAAGGRNSGVTVEVKRRRTLHASGEGSASENPVAPNSTSTRTISSNARETRGADGLTNSERQARLQALQNAASDPTRRRDNRLREQRLADAEEAEALEAARQDVVAEEIIPEPVAVVEVVVEQAPIEIAPNADAATNERLVRPVKGNSERLATASAPMSERVESRETKERRRRAEEEESNALGKPRNDDNRRGNKKLSIPQMMEQEERVRSLASVRRAREKARRLEYMRSNAEREKIIREVTIPDLITVQELSSRMAERLADVTKALMKMGMIVTPQQNLDADTAELIVTDFGHKAKRVMEADVENVLSAEDDSEEIGSLQARPPVVTIMGHVDHGKTSLLDALRKTTVAAGEAGGITQHIGAYQVKNSAGHAITFLDTPGHEAFTAMRKRGANVTDIVVLVVAADDGIKAQTVEAIHHAKAAGVPIIVAINKIDKPDANPQRARQQLLEHELVTEELGGDVLAVEVSAKTGLNLDKLQETIALQAEVLQLKANPLRRAQGLVIEAEIDRGRGPVATLLVQKGTLRIGDILVAGGCSGKVRAMIADNGEFVKEAGPSFPVQVLGLADAPEAGDRFDVVEHEKQAREITSYRQQKQRERRSVAEKRGSLEELFSQSQVGGRKEVPLIIKGDVQGSIEAIVGSIAKMATDEVRARVLHAAVGGITESDVSLASASGAVIIGFNVRADSNAKAMSERDGVDMRYYSIIYNLVDDMKALLSGMLTPIVREHYLGTADVRQVFSVTKIGKVAGCFVTDGVIKRGAHVRLLRDNIVIHTGKLKTLRRFKDDVKEVANNFECGMAFENYEDLKERDKIEAFELVEEQRSL
jgi:translation initiation factor IF-2